MVKQIRLGSIPIEVVLKDIKNVHLSVFPPLGRVRIAAPKRMRLETIRVFAISKLEWIKKQQAKLSAQERETPRELLDRESHYVWGKRYLLKIEEADAPPTVRIKHGTLLISARPKTSKVKRQVVIDRWYREQIREECLPLIAKWERIMRVKVNHLFVRRMKTKWGSCNVTSGGIRLNSELAKKPKDCLEYIVVHEMAHLLEPSHNSRFVALMDKFMPNWAVYRDKLNRLPVRHEDWVY